MRQFIIFIWHCTTKINWIEEVLLFTTLQYYFVWCMLPYSILKIFLSILTPCTCFSIRFVAAQTFPCTCWSLWRPTKEWMPRRRWWYGSGKWWRNFRTMRGPCSSGLCGAGPGYPGQSPTSGGETLFFRCVLFIEPSLIIYFCSILNQNTFILQWKGFENKIKVLCWCIFASQRWGFAFVVFEKGTRSRSSLFVSKEFYLFI